MPMPRGNRPSIAAFTSVGDRKASEIVMLTCRTLHFFSGGNLASSGLTIWRHCRHSDLGWTALPICPNMIFGKDSLTRLVS